mmetsp:Transcript_1647/g.3152  ORF Transcript_1647/g.3152 Transcript_1647/m.3152 type:complete len:87 (+) Transcript_1647:296-556(+)
MSSMSEKERLKQRKQMVEARHGNGVCDNKQKRKIKGRRMLYILYTAKTVQDSSLDIGEFQGRSVIKRVLESQFDELISNKFQEAKA